MLRINDRKQQHLFDPWNFLSPKRRAMLDQQWPGFFRDHILDLLPVDKLALAFPSDQGRPTKELYTVLGALALQQFLDLTDAQVVEQLSFNIQWHYALDIAEESDQAKYICEKTLWTMRLYAAKLGIDADVFDAIANQLAEMFEVDTSRQRIDSVHIKSNMARLGRIGIFVRAIDRFLVNLRRHHHGLWDKIDKQLVQRYQGKTAKGCFADVKPSDSKKTLSDVASDLYRLVTRFDGHRKVTGMNTYKLLCRILNDSEHEEADKDSTELNLITHVDVEKACTSDTQALLPAIEATIEKDLAPFELQADSLYGSDENCQQAEQYEVEVVSPTMGTEKQTGTTLSDFQFRCDGHVASCPAGHPPVLRKKKKTRFSQGFDKTICSNCPRLEECPVKAGKGHYYLRYDEKSMRLARRRQQENTEEFKDRYRWRAGVEATMSQYDRLTGVKHLRVRGFTAVRFAAVLKAAGVNLARAVAAARARRKACDPNPGQSSGYFSLFKELLTSISRSLPRWRPAPPRGWVVFQKAA